MLFEVGFIFNFFVLTFQFYLFGVDFFLFLHALEFDEGFKMFTFDTVHVLKMIEPIYICLQSVIKLLYVKTLQVQ